MLQPAASASVTSAPRAIFDLISQPCDRAADALALLARDGAPMTYGGLLRQVERVVADLNRFGIGRNDRVAVVLPNGPELAVAFVAIAAGATFAPLNPDYREAEFDFYLSDLNAQALVVLKDESSPARAIAQQRGIPILELVPERERAAGSFALVGSPATCRAAAGFAESGDVALVLHTSGTTSRPKLVPLTHANVCASAANVAATLRLAPADRCLNVMPLFHIHGLIAATLASLSAGASLVCTPGWSQPEFRGWLERFRPTWYTAVPTIHQSVLGAARQGPPPAHTLRFIRSSSASLPPQLLGELESAFHVPVIEAYGMTEAAHQMCSNPLPPAVHKPGSVGLPAGPDVAVMDESGRLLGRDEIGEIVIRGANVTPGYESNPAANDAAFTEGWFRTGDQGRFDAEGYFFLTGRLKEIINRGGEKVAPREVDEALLAHPAVAQAVAFAVPHARLGEDVAAAVVLKPGTATTDRELRSFALGRLAPQKVPSRIVIVEAIPKGPTGKLQRIGLHKALASQLEVEYVPPGNPVEEVVARAWGEVLEARPIGVLHNFFYIGGDSLLAARVVARLRDAFELELPLEMMFRAPTISDQALIIEERLVELVEALPADDAARATGAAQ